MDENLIFDLTRQALWIAVRMSAPMLAVALVDAGRDQDAITLIRQIQQKDGLSQAQRRRLAELLITLGVDPEPEPATQTTPDPVRGAEVVPAPDTAQRPALRIVEESESIPDGPVSGGTAVVPGAAQLAQLGLLAGQLASRLAGEEGEDLEDRLAELAGYTLLYYVLGQTVDEQSRMQMDSAGALTEDASPLFENPDATARFDYGLQLFVAGVRHTLGDRVRT